jgi:hypothetical protein
MTRNIPTLSAIFFLILLFLLPSNTVQAQKVEEGFERVEHKWNLIVEGEQAEIIQQIQLNPAVSALMRGSSRIENAQFERILESSFGSGTYKCQTTDRNNTISVNCRSIIRLAAVDDEISVPLVGESLLGFLIELPVEAGQGIIIDTLGTLKVDGIIRSLPTAAIEHYPNGAFYLRGYALAGLQRMEIVGVDQVVPGERSGRFYRPPAMINIQINYFPSPPAWFIFGAALLMLIRLVMWLFPNHKRELLDAYAYSSTQANSWLQRLWPAIVNYSFSGVILIIGFVIGYLAWQLTSLQTMLLPWFEIFQRFRFLLPVVIPIEALLWDGWPYILGLFAVLLLATGGGMIARRQIARLTASGFAAAGFITVVILWSQVILFPEFIPYQLWVVLISGSLGIALTASLLRLLTHPRLRGYYLLKQEID